MCNKTIEYTDRNENKVMDKLSCEEKVKQMKFVLNDVADNFTIKDNNTIVLDNTEFKLNLENDIITLQNVVVALDQMENGLNYVNQIFIIYVNQQLRI